MTTYLRTLNGEPAGPDHGHVGWPISYTDVLNRTQRGLPCYWPTDPVLINQEPYRRFAAERGANSGN